MIWNYFIYFASAAVGLWAIGAWGAWKGRKTLALSTTAIGLLAFLTYMILMWGALERPPMRTMGETRLWYSFFLPLAGIIVYSRWHYKWILSFSTLLQPYSLASTSFILSCTPKISCRHCKVHGLHHMSLCTCLPMPSLEQRSSWQPICSFDLTVDLPISTKWKYATTLLR